LEVAALSIIVPLTMPDGTPVWARIDIEGEQLAGILTGDGPSDVGIGDKVAAKVRGLQETLHSVAVNVHQGLRTAAPDQVTIEFGLELAAADDGIVAALTGVSGSATIKVTATWEKSALAAGGNVNDQSAR